MIKVSKAPYAPPMVNRSYTEKNFPRVLPKSSFQFQLIIPCAVGGRHGEDVNPSPDMKPVSMFLSSLLQPPQTALFFSSSSQGEICQILQLLQNAIILKWKDH